MSDVGHSCPEGYTDFLAFTSGATGGDRLLPIISVAMAKYMGLLEIGIEAHSGLYFTGSTGSGNLSICLA